MAPPLDWLMVQLLFYDEIKTVVPASEIAGLPEAHRRFYDSIPGAVSFVNPENEALWGTAEERNRLVRALQLIKRDVPFNSKKLNIVISKDGSSRIDGCAFLHVSKTSPVIISALENLELIPQKSNEIARSFVNAENWLVVEENSADLLMGYLSNTISKRYGFCPITYKDFPFIVNSLNDYAVKPVSDSQSILASEIINLEFPYEISTMGIADYKILRSAYADIRVSFHELMHKLTELNRLDNINNSKEFYDRLNVIVSGFDENYRKFKNNRIIRNVRSWSPWGASSILTIVGCATLPVPFNFIIAGGSISIAAIDKVLSNGFAVENATLFNRLSKLEISILAKADIKYLL